MVNTCPYNTSIWKLIFEFIGQNKAVFSVYLVFLVLLPLQDIGMPHMFGRLVQSIQGGAKGKGRGGGADVRWPVIAILVIMVVMQVAYTLADFVEVKMYPAVQKFVRESAMARIIEEQKTHHEELEMGEITTKMIKFPTAMYVFIDQWKTLIIPTTVVFLVAVGYFSYYDKLLGGMLLALGVALAVAVLRTVRQCEAVSKARDHSFNHIYEEVDDVLRNVVTVLNFDQQTAEIARLDGKHEDYKAQSEASLRCALNVRFWFVPLVLGYLIFFTWRMYRRVGHGEMEMATFIAMLIVMLQITGSLWRVVGSVKDMTIRWGIIQESMSLYRQCQRRKRPKEAAEGETRPGVTFRNVSYAYDGGVRGAALRGVNLWIAPGERVLVVGKIGSGKSTLVKLVMKYLEPTEGELFLDGRAYWDLTPEHVRRKIAYIPQNPILFNRSIYENMIYGVQSVSRERVMALLDKLGITEFADLDRGVGKHGSKLSGGQRQIIWIVRTMLQEPDIVVMDEPTSAIDERTKERVHGLLARLMEGRTAIMVTHDPVLLKLVGRVIEMHDGVIVKDNGT